MNAKRKGFFLIALACTIAALFLAVWRTITALTGNSALFHGSPRYQVHFFASVLALAIPVVPYLLLKRRPRAASRLSRAEFYLWLLLSRLWWILLLELLQVPPYVDLAGYLSMGYGHEQGYGSFPPINIFYALFLSSQQQALFRFIAPVYEPTSGAYLPVIPRLYNLALEMAAIFLLERIFLHLTSPDSPGREGKPSSGESAPFLVQYLCFPLTFVICYLWCTLDLLVVICNLLALYAYLNGDYLDAGLALGLSFLSKLIGVFFVFLLGVHLLKKRAWRDLGKLLGGFLAVSVGFLLLYWATIARNVFQQNILFFVLNLFVTGGTIGWPLMENLWLLIGHYFPPIFTILPVVFVIGLVSYAFLVDRPNVLSFIVVLVLTFVFFFSLSPWWMIIHGLLLPLLDVRALQVGETAPGKKSVPDKPARAPRSLRSDHIVVALTVYEVVFSAVCLYLLSADSSLGGSVIVVRDVFLEPVFFVWLATGYACFLASSLVLLVVAFRETRASSSASPTPSPSSQENKRPSWRERI